MIDFSTLGEDNLPTEAARQLAREIRSRYPTLRLVRLQPGDPEFTEYRQFAVIDTEPLTLNRVIRVWPESLLNSRGLAEIIDLRETRQWGGSTPRRYWALEEAAKRMKDRDRAEEAGQNRELLLTILGSKRHRFQYHDGESGDTVIIRR